MTQASTCPALDIDAIRRDFPILHKPLPKGLPLVFLDSAASAQKPQVVIDKEVEVYENYYANAYRGVYRYGAQIDEEVEGARAKVQGLLNAASPEEILFTSGSTFSINLVAYAWARRRLGPGDEILISEMEHHANFVPWQQIALETGATCRFIPLTPDLRLDVERLDEVLGPRTRLVAITGMSNVTGTINPIKALAAKAHAVGALILMDGAQSVPHAPTDVRELDVDFLAFSGHKLMGPSGIGVLYGKQAILDDMGPFLYGGHMVERVYRDHTRFASGTARFEAGTLPIAQTIALGTAVDYVRGLGLEAIHRYEAELLAYAHQRLAEVPGLRIHGPGLEHKGSIASFTIAGAHPEDLAQLLDRRGLCVRHGHHCAMPLHDLLGVSATVRASFAFYNTRSEIDALTAALEFARERLRLS